MLLRGNKIEISFYIKPYLDYDKIWSTYPLYKIIGIEVLKNDTI